MNCSWWGARAGAQVRVYAPRTTPSTILVQIALTGGDLVLLDGHIGDCGKASRAYSAETGAMDLSTLREPYRIEGKKTLGLEIAAQLAEKSMFDLVAPVERVTGYDVPMPLFRLEMKYLPMVPRIVTGIRKVLGYK